MNDWFKWNGVKCTTYGMHVLEFPPVSRALERIEPVSIPGKSGSVTFLEGDDVFEDLLYPCTCVIDDSYELVGSVSESRIAKISSWLRGQGKVIFANRPEGFHLARITNQISFDKVVRGDPHRAFSIQFRGKPFLFLSSGETPIQFVESPGSLTNEGNIPSMPLLRIVGTGSGSIMCGDSTLLVDDLDGIDYLMVDCEAGVAYKGTRGDPSDPLLLLGTRVTGGEVRFTIPTGNSFLSFTGGITSVTVSPRWRWL